MQQTETIFPLQNLLNVDGALKCWSPTELTERLYQKRTDATAKATDRFISASDDLPASLSAEDLLDENGRKPKTAVLVHVLNTAKRKRLRPFSIRGIS